MRILAFHFLSLLPHSSSSWLNDSSLTIDVGPCATVKMDVLRCHDNFDRDNGTDTRQTKHRTGIGGIHRSSPGLRDVLVTGVGHSGTHWVAGMLPHAHVSGLPHEEVGARGSISWEMAPRNIRRSLSAGILCNYRFRRVVFLCRYPPALVESIAGSFVGVRHHQQMMESFRALNPRILPEEYMGTLVEWYPRNELPVANLTTLPVANRSLGESGKQHASAPAKDKFVRMHDLRRLRVALVHVVSWAAVVSSVADKAIHMENMTMATVCEAVGVPCKLAPPRESESPRLTIAISIDSLRTTVCRAVGHKVISCRRDKTWEPSGRGNWAYMASADLRLTAAAAAFARSVGYCSSDDAEGNSSGSVFCK